MQNKYKIFSLIFLLVAVLWGISLSDNFKGVNTSSGQNIATNKEIVRDELVIYFLDVGQGDSSYVRLPDGTDFLIDGGPDKKVLESLGQVMPYWDKELNFIILTHPHADHVDGLVEVLRRYKVDKIYFTGIVHTAPGYLALLEEIKKQKIPANVIEGELTVAFTEGISLEFLYPRRNLTNLKLTELNNSSIINRLVYKNSEVLFMGDAEMSVEKELLEKKIGVQSDLIKVGHHGSSSSSSEEFVKKVAPMYAVIQVGKDNAFNHPSLKTLATLERTGVSVLRTDQVGTITFYMNGETLWPAQ